MTHQQKSSKMTQQQAREEMRKGRKVTHVYFTSEEFLTVNSRGQEVTEEGYVLDAHFWLERMAPKFQEGWGIYRGEVISE